MKIKNRYSVRILGLLLAWSLGACSNFLDREPYSSVVDEEYWNTPEDAEAAVAGAYGLLRAALANHSAYYAYGDVTGTNTFNKFENEDPDWEKMNNFELDFAITATETERPLKQFRNYKLFYRVVNQCNRSLKKIGNMDNSLFDENDKDHLLGELYFLRAYAYFTMYRVWGEVPLITVSPDDLINSTYVARAPLADVAALIYGDLEEARVRLGWEYEDNENFAVRANKGAVFATLAHMAAWDKDYKKCVAACDSILANPMYELEPRETIENIYRNDSKELIFQIFFQSEEEAADATDQVAGSSVFFIDMLASPYLTSGINKEKPNKFLNVSALKTLYADSTEDVRWTKFFGQATGGDKICIKYSDIHTESASSNNVYSMNNYVIFRLADVMLLKAEALTAEGKNSGTAIQLLNAVRGRAGLGEYNGSVALQRAILDERGRELFVEGHRFFDFVRYYNETGTSLLNGVTDAEMAKGKHYWPLDPDLFENNTVIRQTTFWQGKI